LFCRSQTLLAKPWLLSFDDLVSASGCSKGAQLSDSGEPNDYTATPGLRYSALDGIVWPTHKRVEVMRSLMLVSTVLLLIAPLTTCAQQYACGEASEISTVKKTATKTTSTLKKLRDRVNLKPGRQRTSSDRKGRLVDYQVPARGKVRAQRPVDDQRPRQVELIAPTAPAKAAADRPELHRLGVAQIPATLPAVTAENERVNQIRFLDQPLGKAPQQTTASRQEDERLAAPGSSRSPQGKERQANQRSDRMRLNLRRRPRRDVDPDRGITDPAQKLAGKWEAVPAMSTINGLAERSSRSGAPEPPTARARDPRQMSAEEVAAYVRSRRQSGLRWPWSR
jgi:hypothetical protein